MNFWSHNFWALSFPDVILTYLGFPCYNFSFLELYSFSSESLYLIQLFIALYLETVSLFLNFPCKTYGLQLFYFFLTQWLLVTYHLRQNIFHNLTVFVITALFPTKRLSSFNGLRYNHPFFHHKIYIRNFHFSRNYIYSRGNSDSNISLLQY